MASILGAFPHLFCKHWIPALHPAHAIQWDKSGFS